ncbi:MAG TPA: exopolyphosphatase [Methylomirabilota bacterium]|nr:exopolyphosphatase [Methylomirabilota bacterium]
MRTGVAKRPAAANAAATNRVAVVDIGSNSIRLVVFSRASRAPFTLFNEKVLCGLGRGLDATGRLSESGAKLALDNLTRFVRLAQAMGVSRLDLLATAAVRDAKNGAEFVKEVEKRCRVPISVISGEEEARLSALGVVSGIPQADGLMGDLGGGSLEIVALDRGKLGAYATLPLGPIRLLDNMIDNIDAARDVIDRHLGAVGWLEGVRGRTFYPVGGAWRTLARIHMDQTNYPLHVIHEYSVSRRQAEDLARVIGRLSRRSLASMPSLSKRRVETLPFAALLLERLLRLVRPERIVFSAFGLREGHLFASLTPAEKAKDSLISACAELAEAEGRFGDLGRLLQNWIEPVFRDDVAEARRLRLAACTLSDIGWREHPDYRADQAFTRILRLPVSGIDHPGRVAVALAVYVRYGGDPEADSIHAILGMLTEEDRFHWQRVGLALRLAYSLSAATPGLLRQTGLSIDSARLTLHLPKGNDMLFGEAVERRLEALARAVNRTAGVAEGGR